MTPTPGLLREVLGHFATGVTVVTALVDGAPVGFTAQSFQSLSLDPPLVSVSPARTSTTWPRIRDTGRFCVNVLAADQGALSRRFADPSADRFAGTRWSPSPAGSPVLDGVLAWVDCALAGELPGGDHTIALGRVLDLRARPEAAPLLFYRGRFAGLAEPGEGADPATALTPEAPPPR